MERFDIPTLVKWAGGKKQLLSQLQELLPQKIERYFEPFVGGGAVAFYIIQKYNPKEVLLSDINEELINCYKVIKENVEELILKLQFHKTHHSKEYYYNIRELKPQILSNIERASRTIYLNKTCFNGLYRVNSQNKFNVPIGSYKNPQIFSDQELKFISNLLKNVKIEVMSFEKILSFVKQGDFIYFDPPYYPLQNGKNFTTYTKERFLEEEQKKLGDVFKELNKRKCNIMLSNSDTKFIKDIYNQFNINIVKANRMINCDATKRGKINEVIITNYLIQEKIAPLILNT